jgi:peptide/nickel transport system permease protein
MSVNSELASPHLSVWQRSMKWIGQWKTFSLGIFLTVLFAGSSLLAPLIAPYPPDKTDYDNRFAPPSLEHIMGTDEHGRDLFSRILYGGRVSLYVGVVSVFLASLLGIPLGVTTGYFGGRYDNFISRIVDALFAFPGILWAIGIVAILGPSANSAMLALAVSRIPVTIRMSRAALISAKENDYVDASRALGSAWHFVVFRSVLPNCAGPLLVLVSLGIAVEILAEAGLSYLGLSAQPPIPSWGNLLSSSQRYLYDSVWYAIFPGVTLFMVVLGVNLVGDGVRDIFDPRRNQR